MKKRFLILTLGMMVLSGTITGCGSSKEEENVKNETVRETVQGATEAVSETEVASETEAVSGNAEKEEVKREDYRNIKDYFIALALAEQEDYTRVYVEGSLEYVDGYTEYFMVDDKYKYVGNPETKEAICYAYYGTEENVVFPAEANGYKVIAIDEVMVDNDTMKTLTIEEGIREIRLSFRKCRALESVSLPESLYILDGFAECGKLQEIHLPKSLKVLSGFGYFKGTSVTIPGNVIYLSAFNDSELKEVIFEGEKLLAVSGTAFAKCEQLTALHLPDSVKIICTGFLRDTGVTDFTVPVSFEELYDEGIYNDKVLARTPYTENLEEDFLIWNGNLVAYYGTDNTTVTIPDGVKVICSKAFFGEEEITELIIPEGVEVLADKCLSKTDQLVNLTLPSTIAEFGEVKDYPKFVIHLTGENELITSLCEEEGWELIKE